MLPFVRQDKEHAEFIRILPLSSVLMVIIVCTVSAHTFMNDTNHISWHIFSYWDAKIIQKFQIHLVTVGVLCK